ncbi:hypothetical protein L3Y34_009299 [Caenorhabditis briggsae]|uniref:DUF19 domain-containing protein n=1 Tax=Caenorhabditis briggsae TaxID=6238 RepID=A0AAE9A2B7_CAEBR|nr:hypothetical protein L3Y34_009299 [Caenorhabditis briggsae]
MKLLILIFALFSLTTPIEFPFCPNVSAECKPKMLQLKTILTHFSNTTYPPLGGMYNLTRELCKESKHCLSHCWGASVAYRSACEAIGTQDYSIESDIACGLLKAKSPYCPNLDFFTIDSSLKKQTFIDGKSCFLQSGCFRDLDNYYDSLMDLYTTPPKGIDGKCNTFYDKFQKIQCESLKTMLRNEIRDTNGDKKFNATRIAELSERAQHCADSTCLMKPNKIGKAMVTV